MNKFCPHCGGSQFKAVIKRPGVITITDEGAKVLKEVDKIGFEVVECLKCKTKVTNDDLVENVLATCNECSKPVKEEELVNGLCVVCDAKKNRADIANASPEELIARLLELEKQAGAVQATKIEKKIEVSEKTVEEIDNKEEEAKRKKEEAAKKRAETLAKKKAADLEAKKLEESQPVQEPVINIPEVNDEAPDFSLPDVSDDGSIVPPGGINPMEDPF